MSSTRYAEVIRRNGSDYQAGPCGKPCHARSLGAPGIYRGRGGSTIGPETVPERSKARTNPAPRRPDSPRNTI